MPARPEQTARDPQPRGQSPFSDMRRLAIGNRRGFAAARRIERRVHRDRIEGGGGEPLLRQGGCPCRDIAGDGHDAIRHVVEPGIARGQSGQLRIALQQCDAEQRLRQRRGQANRADTGPDIEQCALPQRRQSRRQQNRVAAGAVPLARLEQPQSATQQAIFDDLTQRRSRPDLTHHAILIRSRPRPAEPAHACDRPLGPAGGAGRRRSYLPAS